MEQIAKYIFEAGMLKRQRRSGWWAEGIRDPESVAEHSFRTGIIALILARMEGLSDASAQRACTAGIFHDMHEARLGDMNKITQKYVPPSEALECRIESEQARNLPEKIKNSIPGAKSKLTETERAIVRDADYLECAFQAKEYFDAGIAGTGPWIKTISGRLKTRSAKRLLSAMRKMESNSWWKGLKRFD